MYCVFVFMKAAEELMCMAANHLKAAPYISSSRLLLQETSHIVLVTGGVVVSLSLDLSFD